MLRVGCQAMSAALLAGQIFRAVGFAVVGSGVSVFGGCLLLYFIFSNSKIQQSCFKVNRIS